MNVYKRILLLLAAISIATSMSAQFRWGPTVGVNFSEYNFRQKLIDVDMRTGFSAGVMGELMFPGIGFGIDFGLNYNMHGAGLHLGEKEVWASDGYGTETSYLHTLQIPINLRFKYTKFDGFEKYLAPFVYGGPVFSITMAHNNLKALDYPGGCIMLQCGVGAEIFKSYQLTIGYCWGMTYEVITKKLDNFSARSRGWKVGLTYLF